MTARICEDCGIEKLSDAFPPKVNRHIRPCFECIAAKSIKLVKPAVMRPCKRCGEHKPKDGFPRSKGRLSRRCHSCAAAIAVEAMSKKPRDYYYSPEYKRIQWARKCKREGRDYVPGTGNNPNTRAALLKNSGLVSPSDVSNNTWRTIEVANARDAWKHWIGSKAPAWWLTQAARTRTLHDLIAGRVARAKRRARKKTQSDGTVNDKYLARLIRTATNCMWCDVTLTLPMHKRYEPTMATIEHIKPLCLGGLHSKENIGVACARCNYSRSKKAA